LQGKAASVYDGLWTGVNILKIIQGQFSGVTRCFAFVYSTALNVIQLVELLPDAGSTALAYLDNGANPVQWRITTAALLDQIKDKNLFDLASIEAGAFYVADIQPGQTVTFTVEYQCGLSTKWFPWHNFSIMNASTTLVGHAERLGLPKPEADNDTGGDNNENNSATDRFFQFRFTITGHCIFYGFQVFATEMLEPEYPKVVPAGTTLQINAS
jgi:hypothetical protein